MKNFKRFLQKTTLAAALLFLLGADLLYAQPLQFDPPIVYSTGEDPYGLVAGDFNGDGKIDLATANNTSKSISVHLGNGDGIFTDKVDYATGGDSYGIATADFNGDGSPDIAATNYVNGKIAVFLGNGDGTFPPKVLYTAGSGAIHVLAEDFNGDGKVDLASANYEANTMSVLLGNGDGTFQPKVDYMTGDLPRVLTSADYNKDGKVDLIALNNASFDFSLFLGNGDGTFELFANIPLLGEAPRSIATGDFNGDGNPDLVTANVWTDNISILLGNGDATFQPEINYPIGLGNSIVIGDFNEDGIDDIALTGTEVEDTSALRIAFYISGGDGTFTRDSDIDFSDMYRIFKLVAADINGDGYLDLVATHYDNTLSIFLRHNDNTPPEVEFLPLAPPDNSLVRDTISIPVQATDDDSGVQQVSLFRDDELIETIYNNLYSFIIDTTLLTDGSYTFKIAASDNNDNVSFIERTYVVDNTPPEVNAGANKIANGSFIQDAAATDTNGIATYDWSKQSGPGILTFGTGEEEDTTISADTDGTYTIRLTATDNAGNSSTGEFTLVWDTAKPVIGFSQTAKSGGSHVKGNLNISAEPFDLLSGIKKVVLSYTNNGETIKKTKTSAPYTFGIDTTKLSNGKKTFKVVAYDNAGNISSQATRYYYVDNTKPTIPSAYVSPSTPTKGKYAKAYYKVGDSVAPYVYVKLQIRTTGGKVLSSTNFVKKEKGKLLYKSIKMPNKAGTYVYRVIAKDYAGNIYKRNKQFTVK